MSIRAIVVVAIVAAIPGAAPVLRAENMDGGGGNVFVWSENAGWLNVQPGGPGGSGMQVNDFEVVGWLWGENIGWVSLNCRNTSSCSSVAYGITNSGGGGVLAGYAWAENAGWVDFRPAGAGVTVNPATGVFDGYAWSENLGWISFGSTTALQLDPGTQDVAMTAFHIATQWRCVPAPPPPSGSPSLMVSESAGNAALFWSIIPGATGFDVVSGDLGVLHATGSFQLSTQQCLASHIPDTVRSDADPVAAGQGRWFLVRAANCGGSGTYNDGTQINSRDAGIQASSHHCP